MTPLRVYRRQSEKRDANGEGDAQAMQRVIFDCTFSRVGRVQVDTLCRRPRRCDMLIRTASPLEPSVRDAVSLAFAETAAIIDLAGRLDFHTAQEPSSNSGPQRRRRDGSASASEKPLAAQRSAFARPMITAVSSRRRCSRRAAAIAAARSRSAFSISNFRPSR